MTSKVIDADRLASPPDMTYEAIVEYIVSLLYRTSALAMAPTPLPWDAFLRLSKLIHETFEVPSTTLTPIMRRLLFALGFVARPRAIVGVGTYVGYAFAWLLRDRSDAAGAPFFETAVGIDVDARANVLARRNCRVLGHDRRLTFVDADGASEIAGAGQAIDLLYLDLDDPVTGKAGYRAVLEAAVPYLLPGALILAHDPCVRRFDRDIVAYHEYMRELSLFSGPWTFPIDECGLSVAAVPLAR